MKLPIVGGRISTPFNDVRPLDKDGKNPPKGTPGTHPHGAIDVSRGDGIFRSPVNGQAQVFQILRPDNKTFWREDDKAEILSIPWRNYFNDIFGAFIVIDEEKTHRFHIVCHFWIKQLLGRGKFVREWTPIESSFGGRFPLFVYSSEIVEVKKGQIISPIGGAGVSYGNHVHWEVHHSHSLDKHSDRIDPTEYVED